MERDLKTVIIAGGFGVRTGGEVPKMLIETGDGQTIIDHVLQDLNAAGITPIIITNGRFYPQASSHIMEKYPENKIPILNNGKTNPEERLGALGDLLFAIDKSDISESDDVLVMPSDTAYWNSFPISQFLEFAREHSADFITVVHDTGDKEKIRKNLGCVIFGKENEIVGFEEKPEEPKSTLTIVAIYLFRPEHIKLLREFKDKGGDLNSPSNIIPFLMEKGTKIFGFFPQGEIIDANNQEEIQKAKKYGD